MIPDVNEQRAALSAALIDSMGGSWYVSKGRALKHADAVIAAGFSRPRYLGAEAEVAQLPAGAVIERTAPGATSEFFVKRDGIWHSIDGGEPVTDAALGGPGVWLALRRA